MSTSHFFPADPLGAHCRYPLIGPCEPTLLNVGTNPTLVNPVPLVVLTGEIIDIGLDWSAWVKANGGSIRSSLWAAHATSPQAPTIQAPGTLFNETNHRTVAVLDMTAATVNDTYWLQNTVVFKMDPCGAFQMPDRTLIRIVAVKVSR